MHKSRAVAKTLTVGMETEVQHPPREVEIKAGVEGKWPPSRVYEDLDRFSQGEGL